MDSGSLVYLLGDKKRASKRSYSSNLSPNSSLFKMHLCDRRGMIWDELQFELRRLFDYWPQPDILIIHLGGNDFGQLTALDLIFSF